MGGECVSQLMRADIVHLSRFGIYQLRQRGIRGGF
jgi:nucleoid DNA-binding protein